MTQATIGKWKFEVGSAASPQVLTNIEEVLSVSGVGKTNETQEVTNFDSPVGTKEFIPGLAEGEEVTIEANYIPNAAGQELVMTAVDNGDNRLCKLRYTGVSPEKTWLFDAAMQSYVVNPNTSEQNTISFVVKISGSITRA